MINPRRQSLNSPLGVGGAVIFTVILTVIASLFVAKAQAETPLSIGSASKN